MPIQEKFLPIFKDHFMFSDKLQGASRALRGKVRIIVFYISDAESGWTEDEIKSENRLWLSVVAKIQKLADESNVPLELSVAVAPRTVKATCTVDNTHEWIEEALAPYGAATAAEYQVKYENEHGFDEAPVVFVIDKPFRSYAQSASRECPRADEFSVVMGKSKERTLIHELLHQFGANDLYYPDDVREAANAYLPNSIMGPCGGTKWDSLTRCLIGWSDCIDEKAALFLLLTQHHTDDTIREALKIEWQRKFNA